MDVTKTAELSAGSLELSAGSLETEQRNMSEHDF